MASKSLKSTNLKWLWAVAVLDATILLALSYPDFKFHDAREWKLALLPAAPVLVLLGTSLISSDAKASMVFGRFNHAYPGHRAFSLIAPREPRFSMDDLQRNVGALPVSPKQQNALWYRLYKKVEGDVTVSEPHRHYLLLRDLSVMTLALIPVALMGALISGASLERIGMMLATLLAQCVASLIGARHFGIRMVANVLTLHAIRKRR
jgi:hypothetical protein